MHAMKRFRLRSCQKHVMQAWSMATQRQLTRLRRPVSTSSIALEEIRNPYRYTGEGPDAAPPIVYEYKYQRSAVKGYRDAFLGAAAWGGGILIVAVLMLDPLGAAERDDGRTHVLTGFYDASKRFADRYLLGISPDAVESRQRARDARRQLLREETERQWNGAPEWVREMSHYRLQRPPPLPTDVLKALEDDGEIKGRKQIAKVTESGSSSAGKGGSGGASSAS